MSLFKYRPYLICAVALTFVACQSGPEDPQLRRQVADLSNKIDSLTYALELQRENDSLAIDENTVFLVPGDSNNNIKTKVGYLTVDIDSFRDFGNGSRVAFRLGNPNSVTFKGMRARLEWKVRTESGDTSFLSPVLYEFLEDLPPGRLTKIFIVIDDIPANRLLGVRVARVRFEQIVFAGDPKKIPK